jgi:hypothetical protein
MKTKLLALIVLAAGTVLAGPPVFVSAAYGGEGYVAFGTPPPVVVERYVPPCPGRDYVWVGGYYYPRGARYTYRGGYWARPPYPRGYWVAPRWERGRYYYGHWRR